MSFQPNDLAILGSGKFKGYIVQITNVGSGFVECKFWDDVKGAVWKIQGQDLTLLIPTLKREQHISTGPAPELFLKELDKERTFPK